jgi:hypothetical protein
MDDIDRELKKVQLQRERLALARTQGRADAVNSIFGFIRRWWWVPVAVMMLAAAAYQGVEWKKDYDWKQLEAARTSWYADLQKFVDSKCPNEIRSCPPSNQRDWVICRGQIALAEERDTCSPVARAAFEAQRGPLP